MPKPRSWIIFEELIRWFLIRAGYCDIPVPSEGVRMGPSGIKIQGRGTWHQIDIPMTWPLHIPMTYQLVTLVEAKYRTGRIGVEEIRNTLGVLTDISQNSFPVAGTAGNVINAKSRFQFQAVVCSASGFTNGAIRFALAHQIFLVDYSPFPLLRPWFDYLEREADAIGAAEQKEFRGRVRMALRGDLLAEGDEGIPIGPDGGIPILHGIRGSYFGVLGDYYPVQFISNTVAPGDLLQRRPGLCRIHYVGDLWSIEIGEGKTLEFSLPLELGILLQARGDGWRERANLKLDVMRTIEIVVPNNAGRNFHHVRLELDADWLTRYMEARNARGD